MALTRKAAETIIVSKVGGLLTAAGLSADHDGNNVDLDASLAWAARRIGITLASPETATSAELAGVAQDDYDDFLDLAEYGALISIQGNLALVDITAGPRKEELSQLTDKVERMLEARRKRIEEIGDPVSYKYIALDIATVA